MKQSFSKKVCAMVLCVCMSVPVLFGMSACADDSLQQFDDTQSAMPEATYEPYNYSEDDSKFALSLSGVATFVAGKILDKAKSTALDYPKFRNIP